MAAGEQEAIPKTHKSSPRSSEKEGTAQRCSVLCEKLCAPALTK
jgi:hypothetical protein